MVHAVAARVVVASDAIRWEVTGGGVICCLVLALF